MAATNTIVRYWKRYKAISPWTAMAAYMATLVVWGILFLDPLEERLVLAAAVIPVGMLVDYLLHRWQTGRPNWESALITASIVAVLMPPDINLGIALTAVLLAIGSKHFLLWKKRHIFNPASVGVAVTAVAFGYSLGWWPDSYVWLTVAFGLLNVWRVKKFPQIISFTVIYVVLLSLAAGFPSSVAAFGDLGNQSLPVALPFFFILFMLPEPVTSMQPRLKQVEFGVLAAVAGFSAGYIPSLNAAAPLWGLLLANAYARYRQG